VKTFGWVLAAILGAVLAWQIFSKAEVSAAYLAYQARVDSIWQVRDAVDTARQRQLADLLGTVDALHGQMVALRQARVRDRQRLSALALPDSVMTVVGDVVDHLEQEVTICTSALTACQTAVALQDSIIAARDSTIVEQDVRHLMANREIKRLLGAKTSILRRAEQGMALYGAVRLVLDVIGATK
jgi:prophage DNA circulation protein